MAQSGWEPRAPDSRSGAAWGGRELQQPVPSEDPEVIWMWGLHSPGSQPHRPGTHVLAERTRGGAGGRNNVPLETCISSPGRLCELPAGAPVPCRCPPPALPYLNISVTSPLASATRTGKPMQAGTRYRRAGCERTRATDQLLGSIPAQGHAHHSNPLQGVTDGQ